LVNRLDPQFPADAPIPEEDHVLVIPADLSGERLDVALARLLPQYSRSRLQRWIDAGRVSLDGRVPQRRNALLGGERVRVAPLFEPDTRVAAEALAVPLQIVHRDAAILVVDKPAGLVVHPGAGNRSGTLQNALLELEPALARVPRAGIVHRLDKDTPAACWWWRVRPTPTPSWLRCSPSARSDEYLALCVGLMTGGGTIDEPIGRHRTQRIKMAVRPDGRAAVTHYRIERRYRAHTLARVQLETGRTHQIRVHLAHIGYPIVGDPVYGGRRRLPAGASPAMQAALAAFRRQALHAVRLSLAHPVTGKLLEFEAPLPADFTALLAVLGAEAGE